MAPPVAREAAAAFDVARQRLSVFGGITANGTVVAQQWEYDGPVFAQAFVLHPNAVAFVTNATSCRIN